MNFDVVIIGASTAGLHAGERLARAGKKVGLFERQRELRPGRRTLIVTPLLRKVLGVLPDGVVLHKIDTMIVASSNRELSIPLRDPDLVVERAKLTRWLASKLETAGGQLFLGHRFKAFQKIHDGLGISLQTAQGEAFVAAREAVIGADGVRSKVAEEAEISRAKSLPIIQAEVSLPCDWDPSATKVWFDTGETSFFFWLIPESPHKGVVGLIGDHVGNARRSLERFLARHNLEPEGYQAAQVALYNPRLKPWTRIGSTPIFLVGDAAGQVKVTTVGGTVSGFLGGQAAARTVLSGKPYRKHLVPVKRELNVHWLLRLLLNRLDDRGYDQLVHTVTPKVRNFLSRYDRDSMDPVVWRLPILEPRLLRVLWNCLRGKSLRRAAPSKRGRLYLPETD